MQENTFYGGCLLVIFAWSIVLFRKGRITEGEEFIVQILVFLGMIILARTI